MRTYDAGTSVTLTAPSTAGGNNFSTWTGCTSANGAICSVTLNANTTVTANYATTPPATYALTVNSSNPTSGVPITDSPADNNGITSGETPHTLTYNAGTSVTLTAPATSAGNAFSSWTGCTSANGAICTVTLNANTTVTANYAAPAKTTPTVTVTTSASSITSAQGLTVTVAVSGGAGNPAPTGSVMLTSGSYTSPSATLSGGSVTINVSAGSLAAGSDTLIANYTPDAASSAVYNGATGTSSAVTVAQVYVLTVNSTNPASGVTITIGNNPSNPQSFQATTSFTETYGAGAIITLTAPATASGNNFSSWTGCTSAGTVSCSVVLDGNRTVTANYAAPTYALTVNSTNPTSGVPITDSPADNNGITSGETPHTLTYNVGTSVTLTALATSAGNTFVSWTGCTTATTTTCNVTLNANTTVTANYGNVLTVNSTNPSSGVTMTVTYPPTTLASQGTTSFTANGIPGEAMVIEAPATAGGNTFSSWTGCTSSSTETCSVTLNSNMTVTANYVVPAVSITPNPATAIIGSTLQFTAKVNGTVSSAVTWSVAAPSGSSMSPGAISSTGLYTTPYPAPATVTVKATSTQNTANSASLIVTLTPPATTAGPALTVDTTNQTHPISPYIYGMNGYSLDPSMITDGNITVVRWGGDNTERYNYQANTSNSIADYYFENSSGAYDEWPDYKFDDTVSSGAAAGIKILGTVPVLGWVTNSSVTACSYPIATNPGEVSYVTSYGTQCGDGELPNPSDPSNPIPVYGNDTVAALTSIPAGPSWVGDWVTHLVTSFGTAANGGAAFYDLDNEPSWWDAEDRDVHPLPFTYDEVTNNGIATALAIKTADPTAGVNGPVMDYWWAYFYSKKDIESGWSNGSPCWQPWNNPIDREAHGGVPFIEYYLQQFAAAQTTYGTRLLDYVDLHTYFAANYNGNGVGLAAAGDTGEQEARLNSTRAFWDPTYTDPNYPQPNYKTDSNYTPSCNVPLQAPQVIPMMQSWVAKDYPGTKTAITEYNWGGQESINGAVAQADILGIFGAYGLDMATLWGPPDPTSQVPGLMAYEIFRNYDGNKSTFGDTALASTSATQASLSVYGALRTADDTLTIVVINKTYGDLTSTLSIPGLPSTVASGQAYLYSNANLNAIVAQPVVTVTPGSAGASSTIANYTFPAQSITLFVVPM
jgi:hypothetical protein